MTSIFLYLTGENALHMAIVNQDIESVRFLTGQYHAQLDQRATGRFFRPNDLKDPKQIKLKPSNYEGEVYYGEYPLAFAASVGNTQIYDYLIEESLKNRSGQGHVNPNAKDSFGNTVVHMVIIHNQKVHAGFVFKILKGLRGTKPSLKYYLLRYFNFYEKWVKQCNESYFSMYNVFTSIIDTGLW